MDKWNPFKEDYEDTNFNSYSRGPGRHLPQGQGNMNKQDGVQLYVTGIPIQLPPEGLKNLFLQTGTVKHIKIMPSKIEGSQNTFGFVTMSNLKEATEAISKLNNFQIDRFRLRVQACQSQEERERRRRKREEDDAFLNTLNCAKNPQQEDSDEDLQTSKNNNNGINNNVRAPDVNLKIDIPNVSLSDLDDSIIKQGPPSLRIASSVPSSCNSSLSDLTITVGNQSRQVKPNPVNRGKSTKVNGVGRGLISTDLSVTEKSYRGMAQALNNNPYSPHSSLFERMTSYESTINNGGKQCLYCRKIASSLCSRCKMPYCGPECQTADWFKHKNICAQVSIMPKELPVEDDGFEVSLGEDIYEYLPKEEREAVKQVCGSKLTSYIQRTDESYRNIISKVSPTHSSPKPDKTSPTKHSPSQSNQRSKVSPNKHVSNKDKPSPGKKSKDEISVPSYKDLPNKVINMNTDILTIVTYIESPDRFWVSETKDMEHAFVYSEQLDKDPGETIKKAPISGQLFACRFEGMWCRSQVLTLSSDNQMAKISYFDFGNVENVPLKRLYYLPPSMTTVYPLAIECRINGVYPTDIKGWPKNCLLNYIQSNSICTINVKQKSNTQCLVTLKGSEGADVIQSMIEAKIAQKERCKVYSKHITTLVQQLKPGQEIKLLIVIAKSPRDFKTQIDEPTYRNTLDAFTTELDRVCEQNSIKQYRPEVNEIVSCKYVDSHWYRAVVLKVTNAAAIVYFMDYGDEQEIIHSNIQPLSGEQVDYPAQAIKCSLKDVNKFDPACVVIVDQKFSELSLRLECKYKAKVVDVQGDVAIVDLLDNKGRSVSDILKECVVQAGGKQKESSAQPGVATKQTENLQQKSPSPLFGAQSPKKVEKLKTEMLPLNSTVSCIFGSFLPNSHFCVSLFTNFPFLAEIMTKINEECSKTSDSHLPKVGEYVCALFQGGWYRARVLMKTGDKITVYFFDYGNTCEVTVEEIRKLNPEHLQLPAQAIHCCFDGLDVPISSELTTQLETVLQDKFNVIALTVVDKIHKVVVTLADSTNINEMLLQCLLESQKGDSDAQPTSSSKVKIPEESSPRALSSPVTSEVSVVLLPINKPVECIFTSFLPEAKFCVGLFETLTNLAEVMTEINTECAASEDNYLPKIGEYVAALFEGGWYRAEVLNILGVKITVLFIDYGNTSDVSVKEIRKLNPKHLKLPAQAITCLFNGIDEPLSKDQQTQLEGILQQDKLSVQASGVTDGVYRVTVIMSDSTNINEILHQALSDTETQAVETDTRPVETEKTLQINVKKTEVNTVPLNSEPNSQETSKGSSPKVSESQEEAVDVKVPSEKLPLNKQIACNFTSILPDSQFCVSLHKKFIDLTEVMTKINEECKATPESYLPRVGEYVCALFQQLWYRSMVLRQTEDKFDVLFIDYGNISNVTVAEIRKLNPELLEFPSQAITCSFDGLKTLLTIEQLTELESILQSNSFTVKTSSVVDGVHKVVVILEDGSNINEVLKVAQGETIEETPTDPSASADSVTESPIASENLQKRPSEPESKSLREISRCDFPLDGSEVLTMFATFLSSREFCVLKADSYPTFCELSVEVHNYCTSNSDSYKPVIGECVCALYQDAWYRALVNNINDDKYAVLFVDFGNTQEVSSNEIRKILPCHLEFPAQAVKCCFAGLKSEIDESKKAEVESYLSQAAFNVKIVGIQDGVHLAIVTLSDGSNLNESLKSLLDKSDGRSPSESYVEETRPKFFELKCTDSIVTLDKSTSVGFEIQHINGICDFYVLVLDSSVKDALESISLELTCVKPVEYKPMKGEYVCCLFEGVWYRAVVIDITSDANYDVLFIDYGNKSQVTSSSVRQFTSTLASIPPLALHCSLYNVIDNERDSLVKFAEFLNDNQDLKMILIEKKSDSHFVNVIMSSGQCLNNEFRPKSPILPTVALSEIRQEKLPQDQQVPCIFSCFLQDSVFCVSLYDQYSNLAEVMSTINSECTAAQESYLPKIGEHICALYQNMWYRAKVLNLKDDKFTVLFIDYGNTCDISVEEIRELNPSLLDLPAQTIKCSFYGVNIPLSSDQQAKIEAMLNKDIIKIQASSIVEEIYKVIVTLSDGINLNDVIIQILSGLPSSEEKPPKKTDSKKVEAAPEPTTAPQHEIQHYKLADMKFVVPSDDELTVIFTHVVDPDNIYCHSASDGSTEAMVALSNLCQSMADYCEKSVMNVEPLVDHLYCGLMGEDWYRCVVKELRNDKVLIQYIDIGEQKEILKYNLRPFLPEFITLPVYIFKCAVNGVKPIGEKWGTGAGHLINSFTGDKNKLKVIRREEKLLYCDILTGSSQIDLKKELIHQCLGVEKTTAPQTTPEEDEEEAIRRQIAELQAKLANKHKT